MIVLWTARRSNQSILKEISPDYSLEGLMRRTDSLEKTVMLGKIESRRRRKGDTFHCMSFSLFCISYLLKMNTIIYIENALGEMGQRMEGFIEKADSSFFMMPK